MSWLDRASKLVRSGVDRTWDRGFEVARGGALAVKETGGLVSDLATAPFTNDEHDGFAGTIYDVAVKRASAALGDLVGPDTGLGAAIGGAPEGVRDPAAAVLGPVLRGSERVYHDVISRPIATLSYAGSIADAESSDPGHLSVGSAKGVANFFKGDTWRQAWKKSAENADPGQALALAAGTVDINDAKEVERFAATDDFKRWSGVADALLRYRFDPAVIAGGAVKGLTEGLHAVPLTQEGIIAARDSTRVANFVDRVGEIVDQHGAGAAGRIRAELFPDAAEGAYYSDLLASAPDTLTRRQVVGSLMGSAEDYAALTKVSPEISHQIQNLTSDTFDAYQRERGLLGPGRAEMLDQQVKALYPQADEELKLAATYATMGEIPGASTTARLRASIATSNLYQKNPLTAPLRTITDMLPQPWVNLNDPRSDIQIARQLEQSGLDSARQLELRSSYMREVSAAGRQRVAIDIEAEIVQHTLDRYGVPRYMVDELVQKSKQLRSDSLAALSNRKYDAAGRGELVIKQADGTVDRIALPLHVTQQADLFPLVPLRDLEHAAQATAGWDWDSGIFGRLRNQFERVKLAGSGNSVASQYAAEALAKPEAVLDGFYKLWRPATLLRVGWPARVLGDEQLRIMSKLGALAQMKTLAEGGVDNIKQRLTPWEMALDDGERLAGRGLPKQDPLFMPRRAATPEQIEQGIVRRGIGDYETSLKLRSGGTVTLPPAFGTPGDAENVMKRLNSSSSAYREIVVPDEPYLLRTYRQGTGQWTSIGPDIVEKHAPAWTGAVNRQIKQSAFARQFLAGDLTVEEGARWLAKTKEGVAYAREMGWSPRSFEAHAADVADQVQRYVPTPGMRARLLERDLNYTDLTDAVRDPALRPVVHGEEIAQALGNSGHFQTLRNIRDGLFKAFGQMPTDVLSRNPYFDAMYRMEGERLANVYNDVARTAGRELNAADLTEIAAKSRRFALNESQKLLYDLAEKSELAHMLRFVSPFFMAWQEVATRWAGIAVDNPAYVDRMRMLWTAPDKAGLVHDEHGAEIDGHGNAVDPLTGDKRTAGVDRYITIPFHIPGLPDRPMRFNKASLNLALSGVPGVGPPVQVAVNELVKDKPSLEQSVKFILPFGSSQSRLNMLLPPAARNIYASVQGEDDRLYANQLKAIYRDRFTDYLLGKRKDAPTYAEVSKAAAHLKHLQTAASYVLPFNPIYDSPYQPYINAYRNAQERMRAKPDAFGVHADGHPVSVDEWFLDSFGDEYFWLTQSLSKSNDGVQPTIEGFDARKKYKDLIEAHPGLGSLIIGNEGAGDFSSGVYNSQLAHDTHPGSGITQRGSFTFDEFATAPQVRLGWLKYGQAMDVIDTERVKAGFPNLEVKPALTLKLLKQAITGKLAAQYPEWFKDLSSQNTQKWPELISSLRSIANDPRLTGRADRPDISGLGEYLNARDQMRAVLAKRQAKTLAAASNADLAALWAGVTSKIVERNVAFAPLYYRYLERDPLTGGT